MDAAEKIGLLPGFEWIANQAWFGDSWWSHLISTLLVCWALTPIGHIVWAFVAQATIIPLDSKRQWRSFFPGDLYLGVAVALVITAAGAAEDVHGWWQPRAFHIAVLTVAVTIAAAMTWFVDRPGMPLSALLSPCKLYHNFLLYGGYGYVAFVAFVAAVGGNWLSWRLLIVVFAVAAIIPWVKLVIADGSLTPWETKAKQQYAHPASYRLFWIVPIKGRYK